MTVIGEGTRRLLGNLFELQDLGTRDLKGITGPVQAWAALRASSAEDRFEAMHAKSLSKRPLSAFNDPKQFGQNRSQYRRGLVQYADN